PRRRGASREGRSISSAQPCTNWMKLESTISARLMLRVAALARPVALGSVLMRLSGSGGGFHQGAVGHGEVLHAVETEVRLHLLSGRARGTVALLVVAAMDPAAGEAELLGRDVVVVEALGYVQEARGQIALVLQIGQQVLEVLHVRFVAADVLGGVDVVE